MVRSPRDLLRAAIHRVTRNSAGGEHARGATLYKQVRVWECADWVRGVTRRRVALALLVALAFAAGLWRAAVGGTDEQAVVVSIARASTYQDPALLERAWQLPAASAMRKRFVYQANGSVCGPTSVADVVRSLGHADASTKSVLQGSGWCWTGMCVGGLTLDQVAELARKQTQRKVTVLRNLTLSDFRRQLQQSNDAARRYVINFHRGPLFGQGHGHHSPIGGYLEELDLVFVLDVNEQFKPWLAPTERVFRAMDTLDGSSGQKRGLLRIE
jgi:hypothetical protein